MKIEIPKGMSFYQAANKAIVEAKWQGRHVKFEFNGIDITASQGSDDNDLAVIYELKSEIRRLTK